MRARLARSCCCRDWSACAPLRPRRRPWAQRAAAAEHGRCCRVSRPPRMATWGPRQVCIDVWEQRLRTHPVFARRRGQPGARVPATARSRRSRGDGVPPSLALLPVIESGFYPTARDAGRRGLWQLRARPPPLGLVGTPTGRPRAARAGQRAAAQYFRLLHDRYGDWPCAGRLQRGRAPGRPRARATPERRRSGARRGGYLRARAGVRAPLLRRAPRGREQEPTAVGKRRCRARPYSSPQASPRSSAPGPHPIQKASRRAARRLSSKRCRPLGPPHRGDVVPAQRGPWRERRWAPG